jgi:hypothetical protein
MSERETRVPAMQVFWLVIYWLAVVQTLYLEYEAISGGVPAYSIAIVGLAASATVIGAVLATRLAMKRVSNHWFIKGTTTERVIAVAWFLLGLAINIAPVIDVLFNLDLAGDSLTAGILSTVGSVSFIAILGPGYSEYRDALATLEGDVA